MIVLIIKNLIIIFNNTFYVCFVVSENKENIGIGGPTQK